MQLQTQILIVGGGPGGASLACRLAKSGFEVVLIEREKFPRQKLCGEFISPECLEHFRDLEVLEEMLSVGGDRITQTIFFAPDGKCVNIPSKWFNSYQEALGLSRAEMDLRLLEKAKSRGVKVFEETSAVGILSENEKVCGVKAKNKNGEIIEISADLTVDATGRAGILTKNIEKKQIKNQKLKIKNRLIGFKTHLGNVNLEKGVCEIYFFRGGYGGLNFVENEMANHCFLIKSEVVKEFNSDAQQILENVIFENQRAQETMKNASPMFDWLAVSVEGFGVKNLNPAPNLLTIGDAAAFIDPFTGSGMLLALESAEILARTITENVQNTEQIAEKYKVFYRQKFQNRLRICSFMRRAAFSPFLTKTAISALNYSGLLREFLARSTRQSLFFEQK